MKYGDLVLARYSSGVPDEWWVIGYFIGKTWQKPKRYLVAKENGQLFTSKGFRFARKITALEAETFIELAQKHHWDKVPPHRSVFSILDMIRKGELK